MFALTPDHLAVRDMAKSFADERIAPNALAWDETEHFPVDVLREAAALGMATIYVREEHGGSGMTRLDAALIFEALSTGCPCVASFLSIHNMVAWVVDRFGSPELQKRYLPRLSSMELIASYCLTEPGAGSDAAALTTRARRDGDGLRARRRQAVHLRRRRERRLSRHGAHRRGRRERRFRLHGRQGRRRASASAPTRRRWAGAPSRRAR